VNFNISTRITVEINKIIYISLTPRREEFSMVLQHFPPFDMPPESRMSWGSLPEKIIFTISFFILTKDELCGRVLNTAKRGWGMEKDL